MSYIKTTSAFVALLGAWVLVNQSCNDKAAEIAESTGEATAASQAPARQSAEARRPKHDVRLPNAINWSAQKAASGSQPRKALAGKESAGALDSAEKGSSSKEKSAESRTSLRDQLGRETYEDLSSVLKVENKERDFLLNELRISQEKYEAIQKARRDLYARLQTVEEQARAKGVSPEELKNALLSRYVYWMQSQIGVGNYHKLQQISEAEFDL